MPRAIALTGDVGDVVRPLPEHLKQYNGWSRLVDVCATETCLAMLVRRDGSLVGYVELPYANRTDPVKAVTADGVRFEFKMTQHRSTEALLRLLYLEARA